MARLKANNGFEIDITLKTGIQRHDTAIFITLWKNGSPYLVPAEGLKYCDSEDLKNFRFIDYEYLGTDDFIPSLKSFVRKIRRNSKAHVMDFECWPEGKISLKLWNNENSNDIGITLAYQEDLKGIRFKDIETEDCVFQFETDKTNLLDFYKQILKEYSSEKKPCRVILKSEDTEDEPSEDEKKIICNQKYFETKGPVVLIDSNLFRYEYGLVETVAFMECIAELKKHYAVAFIGNRDYEIHLNPFILTVKEFTDVPFLEKGEYPKNQELIFLRDNGMKSDLQIFCCLDREITNIWFDDWCRSDWKRACSEIIKSAENPPEFAELTDGGLCKYALIF